MAKKSSVEKNNHRKALVKKFAGRRARLLAIALITWLIILCSRN